MITAISSQKGGTGKTSTTLSLAAGLARQNKKVLLIDIDSQANASKVLLPDYAKIPSEETLYTTIIERKPLPIHETTVPLLSVVPSHILLSSTDIDLTTAIDHREARLQKAATQIKDSFDYVFIDCPPALGWLTINALTASDEVIVVVSPGYFELDSINQITETVKEVQNFFNPNLALRGFLFTMSDPTINSRNSLQILRQTWTDKVFNAVIPRNTDLRDAHMDKKDIFAFNPEAKSAYAYRKLIRELFSTENE